MFTTNLAEALNGAGVTVNALHPATYTNTTMVHAGGIMPTVEQGGAAMLRPVMVSEVLRFSVGSRLSCCPCRTLSISAPWLNLTFTRL
jgi:NAD(P)-dependent dehydrogenase (short-subunit alcohol dehydrogenase family)